MLTDRDRAILDFEGTWWRYAGAKEGEILRRFGLSAPRYYQRLVWLLDQPEAEAHAPMTVRRLRRVRDQRAGLRSARRQGFSVPR